MPQISDLRIHHVMSTLASFLLQVVWSGSERAILLWCAYTGAYLGALISTETEPPADADQQQSAAAEVEERKHMVDPAKVGLLKSLYERWCVRWLTRAFFSPAPQQECCAAICRSLVSRTLASCKPGGSNYKIFASRMRLTGKRNCRGWRCAAAGGRWRGRTGWSWSSGWRSRSAGRPLLRSPPRSTWRPLPSSVARPWRAPVGLCLSGNSIRSFQYMPSCQQCTSRNERHCGTCCSASAQCGPTALPLAGSHPAHVSYDVQ